jgi:threonine synthase
MKEVFEKHGVILDPHGAVGWRALEIYRSQGGTGGAVVYETADPGKFPDDVAKAIGSTPDPPARMRKQESLEERVYAITEDPLPTSEGRTVSPGQIREAKEKIALIFAH